MEDKKLFSIQLHTNQISEDLTKNIEKCADTETQLVHFEKKIGYVNITFQTDDPKKLNKWALEQLGDLKKIAIIVCEGDFGWDDYLLLHHFDPEEKLDD